MLKPCVTYAAPKNPSPTPGRTHRVLLSFAPAVPILPLPFDLTVTLWPAHAWPGVLKHYSGCVGHARMATCTDGHLPLSGCNPLSLRSRQGPEPQPCSTAWNTRDFSHCFCDPGCNTSLEAQLLLSCYLQRQEGR